MRFDRFTERAQEAAQRAAEIIQRYGHNQIDSEHILLLAQGKLEQAEYYFFKAMKKDPTNIEVIYNIACLESLKNNKEKAIDLLKKLVEIDTGYIERAQSDERFNNLKDLNEFKELINE